MIEIKNAKVLSFTSEQYQALNTVYKIMDTLQDIFPEETVKYLTSPVTGEIVDVKEFSRVKGIIDFIVNIPFEIEIK